MMQRYFYTLCVISFISCAVKRKKLEVIVENIRVLDSVPSGSGLVVISDSIFIMGDDATALYQLSSVTGELHSIPLLHANASVYRIDKPSKHDLESLAVAALDGKKYLLAFGSGSVSPQRDSMLMVSLHNLHEQQWVSLDLLYATLRKMTGEEVLNIEGAVISGRHFFLFNRSGNRVFYFDLPELESFIRLNGAYHIKNIRVQQFALPSAGGIPAGFSGAAISESGHIFFSASAENLPNVYDDGDIQGSYIGTLSFIDVILQMQQLVLIKDKKGNVLMDKIESLDFAGRYDNGDVKAFAVADNDDGRSKLYELRIRL